MILERALATQLQLDVAYATHVTRLNAVDVANVGFDGGRVGKRLATRGLVDGVRPPQEGLGLGVFSYLAHQVGEIVQPNCHTRMVRTHDRLCDGQCALVHGLGRIDLLLALQHVGQVEQVGGHDGMIGTQRSLVDA